MIAHSDAGACGGFNEAICEIDPPEWYEKYRYTYAVGPQEDTPGYLTKERDFLWGAGLVLRKTAWQHITNNGFRNRLTGRTRKKILSGEDEELCLCLQMAGWRLYYEPRLRLKHYLSANRLNLKSLRCMHRSFGKSSVILRIYRFFLQPEMKMHQKSWIWLCLESAKAFLYSYFVLMVKCLTFKGKYSDEIIGAEGHLGRFLYYLQLNTKYNQIYDEIKKSNDKLISSRSTFSHNFS